MNKIISTDLTSQTVLNFKLSQLESYFPNERKLIRITGTLDSSKVDEKTLILFSEEVIDYHPKKFECFVDISLICDFDLNDLHLQHDIVQFIGYKLDNETKSSNKFKAVSFRIIRRCNLEKYYFAIDVQNKYLNKI